MGKAITTTVTIANGESLSGASVDLDGYVLVSIGMPGTWTTANLTVQTSYDGANYANKYQDDGTEYTITASASRNIDVDPVDFIGVQRIKLRSGTSGSAVNQGGARVLTLVLAPA